MVSEFALRRRAAELGVGMDAVSREMAMMEALGIIGSFDSSWVLRGGTALAYAYFGIHRLSEDIDLTTPGERDDIDQFAGNVAVGLADRLEPPSTSCLPSRHQRLRVVSVWNLRGIRHTVSNSTSHGTNQQFSNLSSSP